MPIDSKAYNKTTESVFLCGNLMLQLDRILGTQRKKLIVAMSAGISTCIETDTNKEIAIY